MRIYIQDDKKSVKSADNSDFMLTFGMSFSYLSCFALQHKVSAISDMAT